MQQKIKGIWDKVTQRWKGLSKKIKGLLAALLVLVLVGVVLLVVFTGTDSTYTTLFTGLTQGDLSGIVTYSPGPLCTPTRMSLIMSIGSSYLGLSDVTTVRSARLEETSPIS